MVGGKFFFIVVFLVGILFASFRAEAQPEKKPVIIDGDRIEYSDEHKMVHGYGNVIITYEDMTMTADKMAFDVESKEAIAEGNVTLYKDESTFRGKHGHYDFKTEKGTVYDASFITEPLYGVAEEAQKVGKKTFAAKYGHFTTCPFEKRHYRIASKRMAIYLDERIVANHVIFYIGDFPFLYLPYYSHSLKEDRPRVSVIPGKSKDWGVYVLTTWRYEFNEEFKGVIHLDYRDKMGVAEGFTHDYKTRNYGTGTFHGYYMQERRRDIPEGQKAEEERFRIVLTHNWEPDFNTRAFLEYQRQSDENFNKDFFYEEYAKDLQPKSHLSVTRKYVHCTLNIYSQVRVNQFETVVQQIPTINFDMPQYQLGNTKFRFSNVTTFANLNKKTANRGVTGSHAYFYTTTTHTGRIDTSNSLSYPTQLPGYFRWLEFTPYINVRETFYTRNATGNKRNFFRNAYGAGYGVTTKIFKTWDMKKDLAGIKINRLRHLITPSITYTYAHAPSVLSKTLDQYDSVDALGAAKVYCFALNNKLQTKWRTDEGDLKTVDLINFGVSAYLYPQREGRNVSDIFTSLKIMPFRWLMWDAGANYDWVTKDFEGFNLTFKMTVPRCEVDATHRFLSDYYSETTFRALYNLSPKWKVGFYERYDFTRKRLNEQEYFLSRDLHDWIFEVTWNIERGYGESIMIVFRNKAFPQMPIQYETSYHQRKVGSQSEPTY